MLPVTLNGGMSMPAWYDIRSLDEADKDREDMEGVDWSVNFVRDLVREEETSHGLNSDRVIVGGFSQVKGTFCQRNPGDIGDISLKYSFKGGAVSLRTALTSDTPLGGCLALSCYLPGDPSSYKSSDHQVPVLQVISA